MPFPNLQKFLVENEQLLSLNFYLCLSSPIKLDLEVSGVLTLILFGLKLPSKVVAAENYLLLLHSIMLEVELTKWLIHIIMLLTPETTYTSLNFFLTVAYLI